MVVAGLALIAAATLTPDADAQAVATPTLCIICGEFGATDFVLNVILFVPLGVGLRLSGLSWRAALGVVALTTLSVESLQWRAIAGRDASLGDLVSNSVGGALGIMLAGHWRTLAAPPPALAHRLAWSGAAGWLALAIATALSGQAVEPSALWLWRRAPIGAGWAWFPGRVLDVAAGEAGTPALPEAPTPIADDDRRALRVLVGPALPQRLEVIAETGGLTRRPAALATLVDDGRRNVLALGQLEQDLTFDARTWATAARFRNPGLAVEKLFAARDERSVRGGWPVAGDTIWASGEYARRRLHLRVRWRGGEATAAAMVHPFVGWSYLLPWSYRYGRSADLLSALWAGGLIVPAAYWAGRARRRRRDVAMVVAAALAGLAVVPAYGSAPTPAAVWASVAVATALGVLLGAHLRPTAQNVREGHGEALDSELSALSARLSALGCERSALGCGPRELQPRAESRQPAID